MTEQQRSITAAIAFAEIAAEALRRAVAQTPETVEAKWGRLGLTNALETTDKAVRAMRGEKVEW